MKPLNPSNAFQELIEKVDRHSSQVESRDQF